MLTSGLASLSPRWPWMALDLWISRRDLLLGLLFVVVPEAAHRRCRDELTDVRQETLAIRVTAVRPQGECRVSQAPQVAHALSIARPAKPRVLKDSFFQFGVCNLAVRPRFCDAQGQQSERRDYCSPSHGPPKVWNPSANGRRPRYVKLFRRQVRTAARAVVRWSLLDNLNDPVRPRIDQHCPLIHDGVAIVANAVFGGHLIVGDPTGGEFRTNPQFLLVPVGLWALLDDVLPKSGALVIGQAANDRSAYASNYRSNRAADDGTPNCPRGSPRRGSTGLRLR